MRNVLYGFGNKPKIEWVLEFFVLQYHTILNGSGNFGLLKVDFNLVQPLTLTVEEMIL